MTFCSATRQVRTNTHRCILQGLHAEHECACWFTWTDTTGSHA